MGEGLGKAEDKKGCEAGGTKLEGRGGGGGQPRNSRIAVWHLVVAFVGFHGELEIASIASEARLVPYLKGGKGKWHM